MRGGALPPALLCAALGFALSFARDRDRLLAILVAVVLAFAASFLTIEARDQDAVFLGCWCGVVLAALAVHLPRGVGPRIAILLAANSGVWTGAVIAAAGSKTDLLKALPFALLCIPGGWLARRNRGIVVKVMASWLIAVAVLAAALPLTPTPGYKPDHMD